MRLVMRYGIDRWTRRATWIVAAFVGCIAPVNVLNAAPHDLGGIASLRAPSPTLPAESADVLSYSLEDGLSIENPGRAPVRYQWRESTSAPWSPVDVLRPGKRRFYPGRDAMIVRLVGQEPRQGVLLKRGGAYRLTESGVARIQHVRKKPAQAVTDRFLYITPETREVLQTLQDPSASLAARQEATRKLASAGGASTPGLIQTLVDPTRDYRAGALAAAALAEIGAPAVPSLVRLLANESPAPSTAEHALWVESRWLASEALVEIGAAAEPALRELLADREQSAANRALAADILGRLRPTLTTSVEALRVAATDEELVVRRHAAAALRRIARELASDRSSTLGTAEAHR